ncbi:MAG: bacteriophage holin [Nitrospirota bacterium]
MKLKPVALGLSLGIVWGGALFITTWLSYLAGYGKSFLEVMAVSLYPGYSISPTGSIIGFLYGFIDLFIMGIIIGWIYNRLIRE